MANPMKNPDYAMWAGLNNRVIPFPASGIPPKQPPKPDYGLKENIPITPISGGGATGVPGTATRPSYPPKMSTRPSTNLSQLPPAQAQQQGIPWSDERDGDPQREWDPQRDGPGGWGANRPQQQQNPHGVVR